MSRPATYDYEPPFQDYQEYERPPSVLQEASISPSVIATELGVEGEHLKHDNLKAAADLALAVPAGTYAAGILLESVQTTYQQQEAATGKATGAGIYSAVSEHSHLLDLAMSTLDFKAAGLALGVAGVVGAARRMRAWERYPRDMSRIANRISEKSTSATAEQDAKRSRLLRRIGGTATTAVATVVAYKAGTYGSANQDLYASLGLNATAVGGVIGARYRTHRFKKQQRQALQEQRSRGSSIDDPAQAWLELVDM
jgi:hypothetical protein